MKWIDNKYYDCYYDKIKVFFINLCFMFGIYEEGNLKCLIKYWNNYGDKINFWIFILDLNRF